MNRTELIPAALAYLRRDVPLFANPLEVLRRGSGDLLAAGPEGVLLYDHCSMAYFMSAPTPALAERLLHMVPQDALLLVGHEMDYYAMAMAWVGSTESQICFSAAYLGKGPLPLPEFAGQLRRLDESWAPWLYAHYSHPFGGVAYMVAAIERGMLGLFPDGGDTPAGFVGFHAEGSIGMLEVLPPYRRQGLGEVLQCAAVNFALEQGWLPFGQVFDDNTASLSLQQKVGMTLSRTKMFWAM